MEFIKVQKRTAKKLYNSGKTIYLVPCNVYPSETNMWIKPCDVNNAKEEMADFDSIVNGFEYFNCNDRQTGRYTSFYIKE